MNVSRVFVCLFFFLVVVLPHQFYFSIRKVSVNIGNFIANVVYILLLYAVCLPCSKSFSVGGRNTSSCKQIEFHLDDAYTFSYFLLYFSSFVVDLSLDCSFLDFNSSLPLSLSLSATPFLGVSLFLPFLELEVFFSLSSLTSFRSALIYILQR